jgi:hypothetical protein
MGNQDVVTGATWTAGLCSTSPQAGVAELLLEPQSAQLGLREPLSMAPLKNLRLSTPKGCRLPLIHGNPASGHCMRQTPSNAPLTPRPQPPIPALTCHPPHRSRRPRCLAPQRCTPPPTPCCPPGEPQRCSSSCGLGASTGGSRRLQARPGPLPASGLYSSRCRASSV